MDTAKYNLRNPAVKRIMQEMREIQRETSGEIMAEALEDNIFEWHFAIRGPPDTEFEGGIYQGRIILPPEYPFKPPSFIMITPSGRFETGTKICLSMSSHHPEHWQPSWSVRVALVALIAFLPTSGHGAIGSLDFTKDERRALAQQSRRAPPTHGSEAKQIIINSLHMRMLAADKAKQPLNSSSSEQSPSTTGEQPGVVPDAAQPAQVPTGTAPPSNSTAPQEASASLKQHSGMAQEPVQHSAAPQVPAAEDAIPVLRRRAMLQQADPQTTTSSASQAVEPPGDASLSGVPQQTVPARAQTDWEDLGLTVLAIFLSVVIVVILLRKLLLPSSGSPDVSMDVDVSSFE